MVLFAPLVGSLTSTVVHAVGKKTSTHCVNSHRDKGMSDTCQVWSKRAGHSAGSFQKPQQPPVFWRRLCGGVCRRRRRLATQWWLSSGMWWRPAYGIFTQSQSSANDFLVQCLTLLSIQRSSQFTSPVGLRVRRPSCIRSRKQLDWNAMKTPRQRRMGVTCSITLARRADCNTASLTRKMNPIHRVHSK